MGATLAGIPFSIDPTSVRWDFQVHTTDSAYLGGKVVQVFGATVGDIYIEGHFRGEHDWQWQYDFLQKMKALGKKPVNEPNVAPFRFAWPEQGWNFQVYLRQFSTPDGSRSLVYRPSTIHPRWRIVLFPVHGTNALKQASITTFIDRLSQGMGWKPSTYNGPLTFTDLQASMANMGATDLADFFAKAFGIGQATGTAGMAPPTSTAPGTTPSGRVLSADEVTTVAHGAGLTGQTLRTMVAISKAESGWDPSVVNDNASTGDYSVGLWQINMLAHKTRFGTEAELKIPERNAAAMASLLKSQGLGAWSVYTKGTYLAHMAEADAAAARMGL